MSTNLDRYYVRLKGRVLGPITEEKFQDLVRRKQIEESHEVSSDGVHWRTAGSIDGLFQSQIKLEPVAKQEAPKEPEGNYYLTIDGQTHGPYGKEQLRALAMNGQLTPNTPVHMPTTNSWVNAGLCFPEWFQPKQHVAGQSKNSTSDSRGGDQGDFDVYSVGKLLSANRGWIFFSATAWLLASLIYTVQSLIAFAVALGTQAGGPALMFLFQMLIHATSMVMAIFLFLVALQFGKCSASSDSMSTIDAVAKLNSYWKALGISWIFCIVCMFFIFLSSIVTFFSFFS